MKGSTFIFLVECIIGIQFIMTGIIILALGNLAGATLVFMGAFIFISEYWVPPMIGKSRFEKIMRKEY